MISGIDYGKGNDKSCTVTFVSPEYIKQLEKENFKLQARADKYECKINKAVKKLNDLDFDKFVYGKTALKDMKQSLLDLLKGDKE